jgi:outer membrane protein W
MQIASWLLVTSTLVAPAVRPATTATTIGLEPAPPAVSVSAADSAQQRATMAPPAATTPSHRLGFGGSLAVSNQGFSGSTRYWFSTHVGLSMAAGWYRPRLYGYSQAGTSSSTLMAMPSLMVTFSSTDPNREVSLRPYLGAGVSYLHATTNVNQVVALPGTTYSSTTPVALGGTELFFRDHPSLTVSVDGIYYRLPSQFVNRANFDNLNVQVSVHFYLK